MARLPAIVEVLARHDSRGAKTIDNYARVLREAGLLPRGKRGVGAPHLEVEHVANLLLALAGTPEAMSAPSAVNVLRNARLDADAEIEEGVFGDSGEAVKAFDLPGEIITLGGMVEALINDTPRTVPDGNMAQDTVIEVQEVGDHGGRVNVWVQTGEDDGDTGFRLVYLHWGERIESLAGGERDAAIESVLNQRHRMIRRSTFIFLPVFQDLRACLSAQPASEDAAVEEAPQEVNGY